MRRILVLILALLVLTETAACSFGDEGAIRSMFESQVRYLNERNVDAYMTTIASEAPGRAMTEVTMRQMAAYDLRYSMDDFKVLNMQDGHGVVRVVQTTRAVGAPPKILLGLLPFNDNRSTIEHTVVKESKGWKVLRSNIINSEPLAGGSR